MSERSKVTLPQLLEMKERGQKITMITAYDYPTGVWAERAEIPIISIGAGPDCDGQLLIFHDMFGLYPAFTPKFAKQYADVGEAIVQGLKCYAEEVREGLFPEPKHGFTISDQQYEELLKMLE